ncbi:MAG: hypothetical protein HJJLKODD_02156 [Phycisphaerae bacterium]|nr:hypothetical protein [Phycisphaerae bacterium]
MTRFCQTRLFLGILVLTANFTWLSPSWADESQTPLDRAVQAYNQGDFEQSLSLLQEIETAKLTTADQEKYGQYLELAESAVAQRQQATQDLDNGDLAISRCDLSGAKTALGRVLQNDFASAGQKEKARLRLADVAKRERKAKLTAAQTDGAAQAEPAEEEQTPSLRADALVQQGMAAMQAGDYALANDYFTQALELVPGHPDATQGLEQVQLHLQVEITPEMGGINLLDRIRQRRDILWQRAVTTFRDAEKQIQALVKVDRYDEANKALLLAKESLEAARQYADPLSKYENLKAEYQVLADMVAKRERQYNEDRAYQIRADLQAQEAKRQDEQEEERRRQIDLLMDQVLEKKEERDYRAAEMLLRQVLVIDPKNAQAEWMLDDLRERSSAFRQTVAMKTREHETREILTTVEEDKTPWHKEINYPSNWNEMIRSPYRQVPGEFPLDSEESDFEEAFQSRIPEISFNQTKLGTALDELASIGKINIVPNWPDLAVVGVTKETPVTLKLKDITLKTALKETLDQIEGGSTGQVSFASHGEIVKVASADFLNRDVYALVYNVRHLIHPRKNNDDAPEMGLHLRPMQYNQSTGRMEPVFSPPQDPREVDTTEYYSEEISDLINLIMQHVQPGSWKEQGGLHASIHAGRDGNIVVTQTSAGHQEIYNLLNQLREDNAVQIAIEARFLTVTTNFLEDMGVDLDVILNNGNAGYDNSGGFDPATGGALLLPRNFSRLGFTPNVPGFGSQMGQGAVNQPYNNVAFVPTATSSGGNLFTPVPVSNNIGDYVSPQTLVSDVQGSFAGKTLDPAFAVGGSFLDNIQVDFLLRATQADARNTTLIAPKLILTNGQQSWIAVTQQRNYVSTLQPVVSTGAGLQAPIIDVVNAGAVLNVQATASPDRRYVYMNLQPGTGRVVAVDSFPFTGGPTTGVGASGVVQLPVVQLQQIKTTVTVPDGGTLLVGGQKSTAESEIEAGVPVLSKIPVLKRLYSSRAIVKDESVLLILVKPQILIQEEQEELAFPSLSSSNN